MPHDPMPADLALDAEDNSFPWASRKTKNNSLRAAMKEAGRALVSSAKHSSGRAILASAMAVAAMMGATSRKTEAQIVYTDSGQGFDETSNALIAQGPANISSIGIAISKDNNVIYMGENSNTNGASIVTFDLPTQTPGPSLSMGNVLLGSMAISSDGQSLYTLVTPAGSAGPTEVAIINTATDNITGSITLPFTAVAEAGFSSGVAFTADKSSLYIVNSANTQQIAQVNLASGSTVSTFSLPYIYTDPQGVNHNAVWNVKRMGFTTDGAEAILEGNGTYLVNGSTLSDPSVLLVMDASTNSAITTIARPAGDRSSFDSVIACSPNAQCYVTSFDDAGTVYVVSENSNTITAAISVSGSIDAAAVTQDGKYLYVSPFTTNPLYKIDTSTNQVVASGFDTGWAFGIVSSSAPVAFLNSKALGDTCDIPGQCPVGDPINVANGNIFEQVTDYTTPGQNPLTFIRYYNSLSSNNVISLPSLTALGYNWRSNYDRSLYFSGSNTIYAMRPDGQVLTFRPQGNGWVTDSDVDVTLTQNASTWSLQDHHDTVENYVQNETAGLLASIVERNGYSQTLTRSGNQLTVTDSYDRTLTLTYSSQNLLQSVTTPDGLTLTYDVDPNSFMLTSVTYSTVPATSTTYVYENSSFPKALTGVIDEKNNRYQTWAYDSQGRGTSSERGGSLNADYTQVTYNANGTTTVTNAFGVADTYTFTTLQGVPKVTQISRAATSTTAAATETFGYDASGYVNSRTDWNANQTTFVNNTHGDPTTIDFAVGSTVAFTETIQYDPTFVHLPQVITLPGVTSTYGRDGNGNPLNRTDVDTTSQVTQGQSRETQWTWTATGQMQSVQLPRTDVTAKTTFGYTGGTLTGITDALGHQTKITQYTGGGLPLTVVDPNNVTTTLTYDGRLNLHTSTLQTTAGNLTTTWTWDPANELQSVQQPDGSKLTYGYDTAHRRITTADLLGNTTTATLDALGGATLVNVANPSNTVTLTHSAVFDALDRITSDIGGVGQTTKYAYDPMGNVLTITPPAPGGVITQTPDALNRLATRTDPAPGGTTSFTYDPFNRPLTVKDANSNTTSYAYSGFGDRLQTVSPDSGTSTFTYDPDSNLSKAVLPGSLTINYTYDADDRLLTVKHPADATLNITRTYDQSGHGFGIGRLTSATDQVGSLSRNYDERGNVTQETRTPTGLAALVTSTSYDAASDVASITYPDGNLVGYARDTMGKVTAVTAKPSGATSATNIVTGVTYEPLPEFASAGAPPVTALSFGNGLTGAYHYDKDYRPTTRVDKSATASIENLSYAYFADNSVKTITDAVTASNTQSLTYDTLDRLKTATASGAGGYGSLSFTWDPVGNIETETVNGTQTTYHLTAGSNRMSGFVTGSTTETIGSSATGNMTTFKQGSTTLQTLAYNKANQLASSTTSGATASYEYDLNGERLEKTGSATGTTVFQYAAAEAAGRGNLLLAESNGTLDKVDYIYLSPGPGANIPVGTYQPSNNAFYFVHTDRLGTPVAATDSTKTLQWSATYLPFGYTSTGASGVVLNLRLPGQETDLESALNHNGYRDYATNLTRYVESDPIGLAGGMNTFQYVKGNPFKWTDTRGLSTDPQFPNWNDPIIQVRVMGYNAYYGYTPGNPQYLDPDLVKAMVMTESGNNLNAYNSDPMQVNNAGDWVPEKEGAGLQPNTCPGASNGSFSGIDWLAYKAYSYDSNGNSVQFLGWPTAVSRYNGGGDPNYVQKVFTNYARLKQMTPAP